MRIGELAKRTGISVQTIRYYERMKLLQAPKRSASGYRTYQFGDLERVAFIRQTQEFGFSLDEIRRLAMAHSAVIDCGSEHHTKTPELQLIVEMFEQKKRGVADKIAVLQQLENRLRQGIDNLAEPVPRCPAGAPKASGNSCPQGQSHRKQGLTL